MKEDTLRRLYQLADREMKNHGNSYAFEYGPREEQLGMDLYDLAKEVRGMERLPDALILPTFFTHEAACALLRTQNLYWFWRVIHGCITLVEADGTNSAIDIQAVVKSASALRTSVSRHTTIDVPTAKMDQATLALHVALGILLVKTTGATPVLVRNRIYHGPCLSLPVAAS